MATKLKNNPPLGRRPKVNKDLYGQVTCVLRLDTIERLKEGSGSKHFGEYLQAHLDRYPPPSREQYRSLNQGTPYWTQVKRKKVQTIMAHSMSKESKKVARERARRERLSPEERAWEDRIAQTVTKTVEAAYAGHES